MRATAASLENFSNALESLLPIDDVTYAFDTTVLWQNLDKVKARVETEANIATVAVGSATAVTATVSVGYVLWTIRGGYLMASMISTLPAWRMIDPLPVLEGSTNIEDDPDDDSLEGMIERSRTANA